MLDDLKYIHEKDVQDTLGIAGKQWEQLLQSFNLGSVDLSGVQNVVYGAMGGSALAALLLYTWPTVNVPFEIVRNYTLPSYVGKGTLFIAASYSGNTEETLSALADAEHKGARIAVIAAGGKLQEIAEEKSYPFLQIPKVDQPRYAVLYNLKALAVILEHAGLLAEATITPQLEQAATYLKQHMQAWAATVPTAQNPAKQLAQELMGKSVVIYGGPEMYPAAYKWKISCNENAKHIAWVNQLPEFNHNEFIGWSKQPVNKPYAVVDLRSSFEHPRVQKRFELSARLLSGMRPEPQVVQAQGDTLLEQLLWSVAFGDFVTLYLALLNGINPAPVDLVETFKKEMDK